MASYLQRLARACATRGRLVVSCWLLLLVAVGGSAAAFGKPFDEAVTIPGLESTQAIDTLAERFGGSAEGSATADVVLRAPSGTLATDDAQALRVAEVLDDLRTLPQVGAVSDPFDPAAPGFSPDLAAVRISVTYLVPTGGITSESRADLESTVRSAATDGWDAAVGGSAVADPTDGGHLGEVIGVAVAAVVLFLTLGTLVAAGLNLVTALIGVGVGAAGIAAATAVMDLQSTTTILAVMLGLAVGIDYGLFILSRLRQELLAGRPALDAIGVAAGTAGSAVVTAGLTVVIALAGLSVVGIPFLTQMGVAASAAVAVAVLVALTLLPAAAGLLGTRVLPRRLRALPAGGDADVTSRGSGTGRPAEARGGWALAWARLVTRHRVGGAVAVVVLLGVLSVPVASLSTTLGDDSTAQEGSQQRRAYELVAEHWGPGFAGPLQVLVDGGSDPVAQATELVAAAEGSDLVAPGGVIGPVPAPDGSAALVTVVPRTGPSTPETTDLVHELRDAAVGTGDSEVSVTGQTAVSVDVSEKLEQALPVYLVLVVGLALVLLLLVFRSVLVAVTAVLGFLLTIGATLGATVAVFEWGWLQQLVNTTSTAPIISFAPILVVGILFGLAMDYQIFIVSRIHEARTRGEEPVTAVVSGFRATAPVVLAAATIMFSVFFGFVPEGTSTIKPIAFALAFGVLVDALLVRMVLVPALLSLLGRAAWWMPAWLRWLPHLDVEGSSLRTPSREGNAPAVAPPDDAGAAHPRHPRQEVSLTR